jgi:hypothetical protein
MGNCNSKPSRFENTFLDLLTGLSQQHKNVLQARFIKTVEDYRRRVCIYDSVYHYGRFISNLSSVLVPALLSIQYSGITNVSNTEDYVRAIFWLAWFLSLTVTVINNTLGVFRVEKKYFLLHIILAQLLAEGYQYAQLTGRYSGFLLNSGIQTTHENQFVFFVHAVERIIMRETDIEYFRLYDANQNLNITNQVGSGSGVLDENTTIDDDIQHPPTRSYIPHAGQALYHPTPEHPITPIDDGSAV